MTRLVNILSLKVAGLFFLVAAGCVEGGSYEDILKQELARGVSHDSLFYGLSFNMTWEEFYDHSFEMNQKGIFFQNGMNLEVQIRLEEGFKHPVILNFFPVSDVSNLINGIDGKFQYQNWAPFNDTFSGRALEKELARNLEKWYGGRAFMQIPHPQKYWEHALVKIDGNRQITLMRAFDDSYVEVKFEDLYGKCEQEY